MPLIWCSTGFSSFFKEGRLKLQYTRGVSFWALDIAMKSHFNTKLIELWRISVRRIFPIIFMILSGNRSLQLFLWIRDGGVWILPLFSGSHHSVDHGIVYKIFCWKSNYTVIFGTAGFFVNHKCHMQSFHLTRIIFSSSSSLLFRLHGKLCVWFLKSSAYFFSLGNH